CLFYVPAMLSSSVAPWSTGWRFAIVDQSSRTALLVKRRNPAHARHLLDEQTSPRPLWAGVGGGVPRRQAHMALNSDDGLFSTALPRANSLPLTPAHKGRGNPPSLPAGREAILRWTWGASLVFWHDLPSPFEGSLI